MVGLIERAAQAGHREPRHDAAVQAELRGYRMAPRAAAVLDLSAGGAMLDGATADLRIGDEMVFVLGTVQCVATISWLHERACGITFHRPLDRITLGGLQRLLRR